jgi:hypothetical protein
MENLKRLLILRISTLLSWTIVLSLAGTAACKKSDKDSGGTNSTPPNQENQGQDPTKSGEIAISADSGTVYLNFQAVNVLDATNSRGDTTAAAGTLAIDTSASLLDTSDITSVPADKTGIVATATSIISGPPKGFRIVVKKIVFKGESFENVIFKSESGVEVAIEGASVDLAGVIAAVKAAGNAAEGEELGFAVPQGEYKSVELVLERRAYIKGCLKGLFENHYNETGPTDPNWTPLAELSGEHEYCTQQDKDLFTAALPEAGNFAADAKIPNNADFEKTGSNNIEGEWMKIALGSYPSWPKTASWYDSDINEPVIPPPTDEKSEHVISYDVKGGFKVEKDQQMTLTMLIDMNRLLRYENGAKNHPRDFPTHRNPSFFFDTSFNANSFIFVGKPGKIYGYEIKSLVCKDSDLSVSGDLTADPATATCSSGFFPVNTWMTLITDKDGKPISLNIQPEDDSRLTTLVGSHYRWTDDPWVFAGSASDKVDIRYNMDGPEDNEKFRGTIYDFPADLESFAPDHADPFIVYWNLHSDDDKDRAGAKIYPSGTTKFPGNKDTGGVAIFWRRL